MKLSPNRCLVALLALYIAGATTLLLPTRRHGTLMEDRLAGVACAAGEEPANAERLADPDRSGMAKGRRQFGRIGQKQCTGDHSPDGTVTRCNQVEWRILATASAAAEVIPRDS